MPTLTPIQKNNVNLCGNPQAKRTLVFVHGLGTDQCVWQDVIPAFADDYRLVLLDNVGSGLSDRDSFSIAKYLNLKPYADDLTEVLHHIDIRDAILVGHSMGAMISTLAALKAPRRVAGLVFICGNPRYLNDNDYVGGMTRTDIDDIYREATEHYLGWLDRFSAAAMANAERPQLSQYFARCLKNYPAQYLLTVLCSLLQTDYRAEISQISVPTLIIQSQHDPIVPMATAEYLHHHIKNSLLRLIDASGHLPHVSAPEAVIVAVSEFLCQTFSS